MKRIHEKPMLRAAFACAAAFCLLLGGRRAAFADPADDMLQQFAQDMAQAQHRVVDERLLAEAREQLRLHEAMARRARELGMDRIPAIHARLQLLQQTLLVQALLEDYVHKHPVSDEQVQAQYQQFVKSYGHFEYELREVVAPTQSQAATVIQRLKAGQSFESLVQQAAGWGTGWQGSSLGWVRQGQLAPPFDQVVATLKPGSYNEVPVHNDFGWHVLELQQVRPASPPPLDQVRDQMRQHAQAALLQQFEATMLPQASGAQAGGAAPVSR